MGPPHEPAQSRRQFLRFSATCGFHLAMLAGAAPAHARRVFAATRRNLAALEPWGRLEEVADGIWALISTPLEDRTTLCNGGIVRGSAGVVVIESFATPEGAAWLAAQTKRLTGRWPDQVVITHYHGDHTGGIAGFVDPTVATTVLATGTTQELVREQDARRTQPPPADRSRLLERASLIAETGDSTVDLGDRSIRIVPREGHTRSDVTVEIDDPSIVFCGDLVWNRMFPNYVDALPSRLSRDVRALARHQGTVYVPGHGPLADSGDLNRYLTLLDSVESAARAAATAGKTAQQAAAEYRLPASLGEWTLFNPRYYETAIAAWLRELG